MVPIENYTMINGRMDVWSNSAFPTYFKVRSDVDVKKLELKINKLMDNKSTIIHPNRTQKSIFKLRQLTDIHLHANNRNELGINGNITYLYFFGSIAILILLIACMNFINISTARATKKFKEVGIRKTIGASRFQLFFQFMMESVLITIISFILAVLLTLLILPYFNQVSGKVLEFKLTNFVLLGAMFCVSLFTGLIAGIFPALTISSFNPVNLIRGKRIKSSGNLFYTRNVLIIFQFLISLILIIGAIVISNQMKFMQNKKLGFSKEQLIVISTNRGKDAVKKAEVYAESIKQNISIVSTAISSHTPGERLWSRNFSRDGLDKNPSIKVLWCNHNLLNTYKMKLVCGRFFDKKIDANNNYVFVINESALKLLNWFNPQNSIGQMIKMNKYRGPIIGVVKDFHFESLHNKIEPILMQIMPNKYYHITARIGTQKISSTIEYLKSSWQKLFPNRPFLYSFVSKNFETQYKADLRTGIFMNSFTLIAIFIACLGLFGLAAYTSEQRKKEIGIRKVLGAKVSKIVIMLSGLYLKLIIISLIPAIPISYYIFNLWLRNFAYKILIDVQTFIFAAIIVIVTTFLTISYHSINAACKNPLKSIRYE